MTESRRPNRRGRPKRPRSAAPIEPNGDADPYRDPSESAGPPETATAAPQSSGGDDGSDGGDERRTAADADSSAPSRNEQGGNGSASQQGNGAPNGERPSGNHNNSQGGGQPPRDRDRDRDQNSNQPGGRRGRRNRRGQKRSGGGSGQQGGGQHGGGEPREQREREPQGPPPVIVPTGTTEGWYDPSRDAGFIRRPANSYLADQGDAYVAPHVMRQYGLRRGDKIAATVGTDHRGRLTVAEVTAINDDDPALALRRPDFATLTASYPERRLTLETGKPAKGGPEVTRRAIDLIAPIGYGQRALVVAPARAGKTMLMQAITEGIAANHPNAALLILLVDERPEEVSEAISWGVGEVIASSFDQPAKRHVEVTEMVLERARRLVEQGKDAVIVLDSLTRMARAFNTAERGTGRTLSGGLDSSAMAKPKAFFGSARSILPEHGGGSLTIIATALVETGSRMDDVIFEEFKGTGNCEIKLDRSLAEKRIFPAFDIGTSGTRREEKLFRADQLDAIYTLRRGLQQMPPTSAMEWLIKRIAGTTNNDALLSGL
jgi:transcription termination factor Rho